MPRGLTDSAASRIARLNAWLTTRTPRTTTRSRWPGVTVVTFLRCPRSARAQGSTTGRPPQSTPPPTAEAAYFARCRAWQQTVYDGGWAGITWPVSTAGGAARRRSSDLRRGAGPFGVQQRLRRVDDRHGRRRRCMRTAPTSSRRATCRPLLRGDEVWCQLFSEPGAGSDLAALADPRRAATATSSSSTARRCGPRTRTTPTAASLLARTDPDAPKHRGHHATSSSTCARPASTCGRCARSPGDAHFNEVFLDGVRIPARRSSARSTTVGRSPSRTLSNERVVDRRRLPALRVIAQPRAVARASMASATTRCSGRARTGVHPERAARRCASGPDREPRAGRRPGRRLPSLSCCGRRRGAALPTSGIGVHGPAGAPVHRRRRRRLALPADCSPPVRRRSAAAPTRSTRTTSATGPRPAARTTASTAPTSARLTAPTVGRVAHRFGPAPLASVGRGARFGAGQWPRAIHSSRCGASSPIVVESPWPVWTTVSAGSVSSRVADRLDDRREVRERPAGGARARP